MEEIAGAVIPGAEHVMEYHVITKGCGWAAIVGEPPVRLGTGDVVMFPHGDAHVLSSAPGVRPTRISPDWVYATRNDPKPIPIVFHTRHEFSYGAPAPESANNIVCGFLGCDQRPFNPLIATLSRSAFHDRFARLVGQSPMEYITQWRMEVATTLLRQSRAPVASIALDVGYESEAAFTRAFKRRVGTPPARWRRVQSKN